MKKTILDGDKPLIFLGDHHGDWSEIFYLIDKHEIKNSYIFSVGDLGIGFQYKEEFEHKLSNHLDQQFRERNINFFGIRGNHDNPVFFGEKRIILNNFELIEDYSIFEYKNKTIQCIGGAISIDRTGRKDGTSYWKGESVQYKPELLEKVDILITHTCPSFCYPQKFNEIVYGWAREDAYLLEDLTDERAVMSKIFKQCSPKYHYYGHFHSSRIEEINNCDHRLLNINEFYEFKN